MNRHAIANHILALFTVAIWGVTFVSTKILIQHGLSPEIIFILRFALAYVCTLVLCHDRLFANSIKDEFYLIFAGITGGSLYFITENSVLSLTSASNVSLIICCSPIFTMILCKFIYKDKISKIAWLGSVIAFFGVGVVVQNGTNNFNINPLGDLLTVAAAFSWSVYCLILKYLNPHYSNLYINRKVFFYGLVTAILWSCIDNSFLCSRFLRGDSEIIGNLIFLGFGASFLCYIMWNRAVKYIGVERTSGYIYLVPLVTIIASTIFLEESVTLTMVAGALLIIGGVFLSTK